MELRVVAARRRPRIIVLGNEKGGSGKSTAAMHLIVGLLDAGRRVGSIDVDARQASLTRYLDNRAATMAAKNVRLVMPEHRRIALSHLRGDAADSDERGRFNAALYELASGQDVVVIDTPGADTFLSRLAHSHADSIVTPMNDSFVDLDLLAKVEADSLKVIKPSLYAEMVWEQRKQRALRDRGSIDWIVMRNRLAALEARNKRAVGAGAARQTHRLPLGAGLRRPGDLPRTLPARPHAARSRAIRRGSVDEHEPRRCTPGGARSPRRGRP
jgi:chromosome partitioning protein